MTILKIFRIIAESIILGLLMFLLWILGIHVGFYGTESIKDVYFIDSGSLWLILFGVIKFSVGICFFVVIGRQTFPRGVKELFSGKPTIATKEQYFPGIFALGVFAGLVGEAVIGFIREAISYMK